eukprot:TRINITY_DN22020_c0_g1_i1.p1 TRINITY_DN22020_c0_g1~~TRINITY_DN22020_c0_g1_i1.p1  ORF type:complete len:348 (+),score=77.15 TRINITY_DN22020_c0_g1_i1:852-1895(+)
MWPGPPPGMPADTALAFEALAGLDRDERSNGLSDTEQLLARITAPDLENNQQVRERYFAFLKYYQQMRRLLQDQTTQLRGTLHRTTVQDGNQAVRLLHASLQHEVRVLAGDLAAFKKDFGDWEAAVQSSKQRRDEAERKLRSSVAAQRAELQEILQGDLTSLVPSTAVHKEKCDLLRSLQKQLEGAKAAYRTDVQRWAEERQQIEAMHQNCQADDKVEQLVKQRAELQRRAAVANDEVDRLQRLKAEMEAELAQNRTFCQDAGHYARAVAESDTELNQFVADVQGEPASRRRETLLQLCQETAARKREQMHLITRFETANRELRERLSLEQQEVRNLQQTLAASTPH